MNTEEFTDYSYDDALIGVDIYNRDVYNYEKMIEWLVVNEDFTYEEAADWVDYNAIHSLPHTDDGASIIIPLLN